MFNNFILTINLSHNIGPTKANEKLQNSNELVKTPSKAFLLKITPINIDLEKSGLGKNNNPKMSPLIIKTKDLNG